MSIINGFRAQRLALGLTMQELAGLIATGLAELTNGRYEISGREMLCLKDPDTLLNQKKTPEDFGLRNGDELVLF